MAITFENDFAAVLDEGHSGRPVLGLDSWDPCLLATSLLKIILQTLKKKNPKNHNCSQKCTGKGTLNIVTPLTR